MGRPALVRSLQLLHADARETVQSDAGLRALFDLLDSRPEAAPKESVAAAVAGRTLWQFRGAMTRLTGHSWRDFVRFLHLRERHAHGHNVLKKAKSLALEAGFSSLKSMRSAERWAMRKGLSLDGPLKAARTESHTISGTVFQSSAPNPKKWTQ